MWCSKKRTLLYICVATIISFILTIPYFFANTWDNDGKVKPTDFAIKYGHLGFCIEDFLIRFFLPNVTLIMLSTIVAIKVSFIQDIQALLEYKVYIFSLSLYKWKTGIKIVHKVAQKTTCIPCHVQQKPQIQFHRESKFNNMTNFNFFQLKKISSTRKEMTGVDNGSRERKLTRTMFCVVILSILYSTYFLIRILLATNCIGEKTFFILRPIYSLLFVINSSANLFIYLYFNNKFRANFVTIFSCNKNNQHVLDTLR